MKNILLSLTILAGSAFMPALQANAASETQSAKQTDDKVKDAYKSMFSVVTYNKQGHLLHSGYGFFFDERGTGIAAFSLFQDAYSAVIIDYKGNKIPVKRILGASSSYDLVKFSTEGGKDIDGLSAIVTAPVETGAALTLQTYTGKKKTAAPSVNIESADDFDGYKYYQTTVPNTSKELGCPLLNDAGELVAVVQKNVEKNAETACAIDARFIHKLKMSSASLLNADLNAINISKGLPENEKEALTYIFMLGKMDSATVIHALNDFIETWPLNAEGFTNRGTFYANHYQPERCQEDFAKAMELAEEGKSTIRTDEIHNNLSKIIYNQVVYAPTRPYAPWTLDAAILEAEKAYQFKPSPYYLLQQAHCYMAKKDYPKAYELYTSINTKDFVNEKEWSDKAKAETWLYAARAYELGMKDGQLPNTRQDSLQVIALLDSTITTLPQPYTINDSPLFLERAQRCEKVGEYRKAVLDYGEYEKIIGPKNLTDKFYYLREQAELKCHMYQQALDDIQTAIAYNPEDPFYPTEKAVVLLRAGLFKEAIAACEVSLKKLPGNPDCYKIMGIAYGELKDKKQALLHLNKAKDLGDPTVEGLIQKYK